MTEVCNDGQISALSPETFVLQQQVPATNSRKGCALLPDTHL